MKKLFIILGVIVVIVAVALGIVWYATGGARQAAGKFLSQIQAGDLQGAYQNTAQEFQAKTSYEEFIAFLAGSSLKDYTDASWGNMSVQAGCMASLEGNIKTKNGGIVPIKIDLVKENGVWKIFNLTPKTGGLTPASPAVSAPALPSEQEAKVLIQKTMSLFVQAVKNSQNSYRDNQWLENEEADFGEFYASLAKVWQTQTDPGSLRSTFSDFITKNIGLDWLNNAAPVFTLPASLDENKVYLLSGGYQSDKMTVPFELGYYYEAPFWKLVQIEVKAQ